MGIIVRLMPMPPSLRGVTIPDPDGNYNIYINQNLAYEMQRKTYLHELEHIEKGHFNSDKPVSEIESKMSK